MHNISARFAAVSLFLFVAGCGSSAASSDTDAPEPKGDGGTSPDGSAQLPPVSATDLGTACGGGCAGSKICTVESSQCESGQCLFDGRSEPSEAYCTADCSNAACPTGYACTDVPFSLTRACVRDDSPPTGSSSPRATGTLKFTGTIAASGSPAQPFEIDQTLDTAPVAKLANMKCDSIFLHTDGTTAQQSPPSAAVLEVYVNGGCDTSEPRAALNFKLPLTLGTFTASDDVPESDVTILTSQGDTGTHYGYETNQSTLQVLVLEGAESTATPWRAKKVVVHLEGDLPKNSNCPDSSCGTTVHLTLDLELANVVSSNVF